MFAVHHDAEAVAIFGLIHGVSSEKDGQATLRSIIDGPVGS